MGILRACGEHGRWISNGKIVRAFRIRIRILVRVLEYIYLVL